MKIYKYFRFSVLVITIMAVIGSSTIYASPADQKKLFNQGIFYYDKEDNACQLNSQVETGAGISSDGSKVYSSGLSAPFILEQWAIHTLKAIAQKKGGNEADYVTKEHVIGLLAFAIGEGGDINNQWLYNPLNTGLDAPELIEGAHAGDGTQSFKSFDAGVEATARTMVGSNQNRLALVLSKPDSTAKDFMTALTYYQRYSGNKFWAAASLSNQDAYYRGRMSIVKIIRDDYKNYASIIMGTPEKEQPSGKRDPSKLQFDGSSNVANPSDTPDNTNNCSCTVGEARVSVALNGDNNRLRAFNFFVERGLSSIEAAGAVGNFMQESGENLDPNASNGTHEGIGQWSRSDRWPKLIRFVNSKSELKEKGPRDLFSQLEYALQESQMKAYLDTKPKTLEEAARRFDEKFEISGGSALDKRISNAKKVYDEAGGDNINTSASVDQQCSSSGQGRVNTEGYSWPVEPQRKSYVNNFPGALTHMPCGGAGSCHGGRGVGTAYDLGSVEPTYTGNKLGISAGKKVYAIHSGTITNLHIYKGIQGCYSLQLKADDGYYYWYGHIAKPLVSNEDTVSAGKAIAEIGPPACTGNGSTAHLHIDRGPKGEMGGYENNRDGEAMVKLMNSLFEDLPE